MVSGAGPENSFNCDSISDLPEVARRIIKEAGDCKVWLFEGAMGAGKTTLIREICAVFEVEDNVSSPTFSLVNEYQNHLGDVFYHFDFYRIKSETEAMDIGCDEYFYSGNFCFIEWPSQIPGLIPESNLTIRIFEKADHTRSIVLYKNG